MSLPPTSSLLKAATGWFLFSVMVSAARGEADFLVLDSAKPGPTLVIYAPEPGAGRAALRQLQHRPPERGRLVLAQLHPGPEFPGAGKPDGWDRLPTFAALTDRFRDCRVLVFREDEEAHAYDPNFRGDTVQGVDEASFAVLQALRELKPEAAGKDWRALPPAGPEILVTTNARVDMVAGFRPALRERELRTAATALLRHLGMAGEGSPTLFPAARPGQLRVAVYDGAGAQNGIGRGPSWLRARLAGEASLVPELVGVPEILQGALDHADVLVMGGGKANLQSIALGDHGRQAVVRFVRQGGGLVGICAGAYVASSGSGNTACLKLLPVTTGATWLECHTPLAWNEGPLGSARTEDADLHGGPTFQLMENAADTVTVWARFDRNETHAEKGEYPLKGTPAVISGRFGKGRVVLTSTHCERAPSPASRFPAMVRWAGRLPAAGE